MDDSPSKITKKKKDKSKKEKPIEKEE